MRCFLLFFLLVSVYRAQTRADLSDSVQRLGRGMNHRLYYARCEEKGLRFFSSANGGQTWSTQQIDLGAMNFRPRGNAFCACDTSKGPYHNRLYICWSDEKNGGQKNEDIYLAYSEDEGKNWTEPILISYWPNHRRQWKPFLQIDQRSRNVMVAFYDGRNYLNKKYFDVSLALSRNGGLKFDTWRLNASPLSKDTGGARLQAGKPSICWRQREQEHCADINDSTLSWARALNWVNELEIARTFAYGEKISINFKTNTELKLDASLTRPLEPGFEKILLKSKRYRRGNHELVLDSKKLGLDKASYILTLYFNFKSIYCWIIEE